MASMVNMNNLLNGKDSRWLQLEVCREFQRNKCSRPDTECKFAHPPANVEVQNGRVTACYDSIKVIILIIIIVFFFSESIYFVCVHFRTTTKPNETTTKNQKNFILSACVSQRASQASKQASERVILFFIQFCFLLPHLLNLLYIPYYLYIYITLYLLPMLLHNVVVVFLIPCRLN